jgi:glycosyltransferase involved in cell wall biosynthesis
MKIAIFYNLAFGGAKRVVMEHAKGLNARGHTVDLYTVNIEHDVFDVSPFCDNVYTYNFGQDSSLPLFRRVVSDYKNFFALKSLHRKIASDIDSRDYDVVLVHPDRLTQSPFILRFLKTPSAYYCQEPLRIVYEYAFRLKEKVGLFKRSYEELTRLYRKYIDRENVRRASLTMANCYHIRERMIESYDVYPKVVYCAVDSEIFRPLNTKKQHQVFYIGSPNLWTDGYDLVKDAIKLIPAGIRPKLKVVSWKKTNGERLSERELVEIYNKSLVTICPSRLETFGLVPLESMACGTPIIATKVSGHRETVEHGKTGFLVDFDPKELAEKITFIITNKEQQRIMGIRGRRCIEEKWTWDKSIDKLLTCLQECIKE